MMFVLITKLRRGFGGAACTWLCGCGASEAAPAEGLAGLDDVALYLNLGDSVGAGFNAAGENAVGARGYARLLFDNHEAYPDAPHLRAQFPEAVFEDRASSGEGSEGVIYQLFDAPETAGDTLATIYVGGNDFNDDPLVMLNPDRAREAIERWRDNMFVVVDELRARYRAPAEGRDVAISIATIHEPTDGALSIPDAYHEDFCAMLWQLDALGDDAKQAVWSNYQAFNEAIATFATDEGLRLIDSAALFTGHGLNSDAPWIDVDCAHLTDEGHHRLRELTWAAWEQPASRR